MEARQEYGRQRDRTLAMLLTHNWAWVLLGAEATVMTRFISSRAVSQRRFFGTGSSPKLR